MPCSCGACSSCKAIMRLGGAPMPTAPNLLQRLAPTVDRLRERTAVRFGLRPYDVSLVWTRWTGSERGEGTQATLRQVTIYPRPRVEDLTSLALSPYNAGVFPVGSVRVSRITTQLTEANLRGVSVPGAAYMAGCGGQRFGLGGGPPDVVGRTALEAMREGPPAPGIPDSVAEPYDFFYEVLDVSAPGSVPRRFRLMVAPFRRPGEFDWSVVLEATGLAHDEART